MCGIAGIIGFDKSRIEHLVRGMTDALSHRGPDASGLFQDGDMALGHRRLSIIDLGHNADQPLQDNTGNYVIVFNGEIYNYQSLKRELDYPWKTNSDTEVILAAYIKWGSACLEKLNGMFAFAIWNKADAELFIARDRLGVKPLYYSNTADSFVFSSEIRSLLCSGIPERKINRKSLQDYLTYMTVRTPETIIKDVKQLCPGEFAFYRQGKLSKSFYWQLTKSKAETVNDTREQILEKLREMFKASVQSRMVADVRVGAFLSGGIDSSAIVACMSGLSKQPVDTFSVVFEEKQFDESEYSRMVSQKYKTNHTELLLKPEDLLNNLDGFIKSMDTPSADGINTYMVSKMVAETGIKVVLTGIGGDELFAGYNGFYRWKRFSKHSFVFSNLFTRGAVNLLSLCLKGRNILKIKDLLNRNSQTLEAFYANSRSVFLNHELSAMLTDEDTKHSSWVDLNQTDLSKFQSLSQYSIAELSHYTLDVLLKDSDQMSMAWALELREPFFDYRLVEYVLSVSDADKMAHGTPKRLFVEAIGTLLPPEIVHRPKKGFTFPWKTWLKNDLNAYCDKALHSLSDRGIFKPRAVLKIWQDFLKDRNAVSWLHIWGLVVLELWIEENKIEC